jgi:hypothetical protein
MPCARCSDPNATVLKPCASRNLFDATTGCRCNAGYYATPSASCTPCSRCDAMDNASSPCLPGSTRDTVACACNAGYYGNGVACAPCKACGANASATARCAAGSAADTAACGCDAARLVLGSSTIGGVGQVHRRLGCRE